MAATSKFPDEIVQNLALRARQIIDNAHKKRILITIAGIPGSGKSTLAAQVADLLNGLESNSAAVVGMDGYHYTRKYLDTMPDPVEAHKRRGAPFTIDAQGLVSLATKLVRTTSSPVQCPTFDHSIKDPVESGITIDPHIKYILLEGLYVQIEDEPWNELNKLADDTWFVTVDDHTALERLAKRHVESGIVENIEDGYKRARENDLVNGQWIKQHSLRAHYEISSSL